MINPIRDEDIDTSEIPELGPEFFAKAKLTRPGQLLAFSEQFMEAYSFFRSMGMPAQHAVTMATREVKLRLGVDKGELRVRWELDEMTDEHTKEEAAVLNSGKYEVLGVIIERKRECRACGDVKWEHAGSCWGIVVQARVDEDDLKYRRFMETEVFDG